jgi:hypothetical protein
VRAAAGAAALGLGLLVGAAVAGAQPQGTPPGQDEEQAAVTVTETVTERAPRAEPQVRTVTERAQGPTETVYDTETVTGPTETVKGPTREVEVEVARTQPEDVLWITLGALGVALVLLALVIVGRHRGWFGHAVEIQHRPVAKSAARPPASPALPPERPFVPPLMERERTSATVELVDTDATAEMRMPHEE